MLREDKKEKDYSLMSTRSDVSISAALLCMKTDELFLYKEFFKMLLLKMTKTSHLPATTHLHLHKSCMCGMNISCRLYP